MKCYACGVEVVAGNQCPHCRRDQRPYRRILDASNREYNEGLFRARVRDLSGAADHLNMSLRYNKANIKARNLLGLVYYESGDIAGGLNEWIISRQFSPVDNPANEYMTALTKNSNTLKQIGSIASKYNQSLSLCRQGSRDLAKIQLRRVVNKNKKFGMVAAYQLLALLFIVDEDYEEAAEVLKDAAKIDTANPLTIEYQKLISAYVSEPKASTVLPVKKKKPRQKKPKRQETIDFSDGNDTIIMPRESIFESMDGTKSGIINILVGGVVGVLASVFLIWPTLQQNANTDAQSALVTANEKAMSTESNVENLNKEVSKLKARLENYEGKSDIKGSYDLLVQAMRSTQAKDIDTAAEALESVNKDLLESNGKEAYDEIDQVVAEKKIKDAYEAGTAAYRSSSYEEAIELLSGVVDSDRNYEDGNAVYYLAQSYDSMGDKEKAKELYTEFLNNHGGTRRAKAATHFLREIERAEREAQGQNQE